MEAILERNPEKDECIALYFVINGKSKILLFRSIDESTTFVAQRFDEITDAFHTIVKLPL